MDVVLRVIAIFIEGVILVAIIYSLLFGAWLTLFDLGLKAKYKKILVVALVTAGCIATVFVVTHLTTFYPTI